MASARPSHLLQEDAQPDACTVDHHVRLLCFRIVVDLDPEPLNPVLLYDSAPHFRTSRLGTDHLRVLVWLYPHRDPVVHDLVGVLDLDVLLEVKPEGLHEDGGLEGHAHPAHVGAVALDLLVLDAVLVPVHLLDDGTSREPLVQLGRLRVLARSDDDAALVTTTDNVPDVAGDPLGPLHRVRAGFPAGQYAYRRRLPARRHLLLHARVDQVGHDAVAPSNFGIVVHLRSEGLHTFHDACA
mmetsp:Transcript_93673/g.248667  ORF Transcript_93673/g.248667 Transcript_93673/m.248667 type:complete len:240 (+) Transcript_93673:315-1034(+)